MGFSPGKHIFMPLCVESSQIVEIFSGFVTDNNSATPKRLIPRHSSCVTGEKSLVRAVPSCVYFQTNSGHRMSFRSRARVPSPGHRPAPYSEVSNVNGSRFLQETMNLVGLSGKTREYGVVVIDATLNCGNDAMRAAELRKLFQAL